MSRETDGFLGRWSARKQAARQPEPEEEGSNDVAAPENAEEDTRTEAEILDELGLRDPDEMEPGDDFSGFMASGVPERLRNRALRKLWLTNPVLANLDELVDYGEDFTDAATVVENLATAYRVGKGFLRDPDPDDVQPENPTETDATADGSTAPDQAAEVPSGEIATANDTEDQVDLPSDATADASAKAQAHSEPSTPIAHESPVIPVRRMAFRVD